MDQYWYLNSKGNGQQYTNQISLYSQPEITTSEVMNDLKLPENWSYRVYPVSWDSSANYTGFNPQPPPFSWGSSQLIMQRYYHKVTLLIGLHYRHAGFNFQKPPFPRRNHSIIQGCSHKVISQLYYRRQLRLLNSIPITGYFRKLSGWGGPWAPMGWGNNGGNGQLGMLGNLLTAGKGTMSGIGMISSLIGMGKFFF